MFRARSTTLVLLVVGLIGFGSGPGSTARSDAEPTDRTPDQAALVDFAVGRFEAQGLELPPLEFIFHDSLMPCDGHKGRFHGDRGVIEMCSEDTTTMLHEMAHAWTMANLTDAERDAFVGTLGLDSWNDHDDEWETRGTEHAAEAIAWALHDDPHHVRWVETLPDGTTQLSHRLLTIDTDVETLIAHFRRLTGMDPILRDAGEWTHEDEPPARSPEAIGGR